MFSIKNEDRNIKRVLILIQVIFALTALIYVLGLGNSTLLGSLEEFNNDDVKYIRSAWNLVENKIISYQNTTEPTVYIMPGLTVVLSWFVLFFGKLNSIIAFRVFQVIVQCGSLYLVFLIGRKLFNSKVGVIACLINSLYIVELYVPSLILMESIFRFLLLLLLYLSIYAIERKGIKLYIIAAIVWSFACLFRPTIVAYPGIVLIVWIVNKEYKFKDVVKYTIIVLTVFCMIMAPWWARNYKLFNTFIPFTASSGNPFLQGTFVNYDQSDGWGVEYKKGNNSIESNKNELDMGIERLKKYGKKEPLKYIYWYTLGKTFYFWRAPFYWQSVLGFTFAFIQHIFIIISSVIGIWLCKKNKELGVNSIIILGIILLFNLVYLPYYTFERYSYPLMSLLCIYSGYLINNFLSRRKLKNKYS